MPVILVETLADFGLLAFEVYVYVNLKDQQWGGRGGEGGWGREGATHLPQHHSRVSCVFKKCLNELTYRESSILNSPDHDMVPYIKS